MILRHRWESRMLQLDEARPHNPSETDPSEPEVQLQSNQLPTGEDNTTFPTEPAPEGSTAAHQYAALATESREINNNTINSEIIIPGYDRNNNNNNNSSEEDTVIVIISNSCYCCGSGLIANTRIATEPFLHFESDTSFSSIFRQLTPCCNGSTVTALLSGKTQPPFGVHPRPGWHGQACQSEQQIVTISKMFFFQQFLGTF